MRIKTVTYRRNVPVPGEQFQHVHVEASADVPDGVDPSALLAEVRNWVNAELMAERKRIAEKKAAHGG